MGITTVKLLCQKLLMENPSLNWFKPVCAQLLDITDSQKRHGHIKFQFSFILCKINFKDYLDKYLNTHISFKPYSDFQSRCSDE